MCHLTSANNIHDQQKQAHKLNLHPVEAKAYEKYLISG